MGKYTEFTQTMLPSLGFNESQIEELVADQLTLNRMKELLGTGTQVAESESKGSYGQLYGKTDVAVVRLRSEDFQKDVKISDEDIAKYYESHKAQLKSDEKRKVEFVTFGLTEQDKKLTGKERVDVLQKLANYANDFTQALLEKNANFGELAIKFHGALSATGEFTSAAPDPQLRFAFARDHRSQAAHTRGGEAEDCRCAQGRARPGIDGQQRRGRGAANS